MWLELSDEENRRLQQISEAYGMTPTDLLRRYIENGWFRLVGQRNAMRPPPPSAEARTLPLFPGIEQ